MLDAGKLRSVESLSSARWSVLVIGYSQMVDRGW